MTSDAPALGAMSKPRPLMLSATPPGFTTRSVSVIVSVPAPVTNSAWPRPASTKVMVEALTGRETTSRAPTAMKPMKIRDDRFNRHTLPHPIIRKDGASERCTCVKPRRFVGSRALEVGPSQSVLDPNESLKSARMQTFLAFRPAAV